MKKIYLLSGIMLAGSVVFAQQRTPVNVPMKQFKVDHFYGDNHPVNPAQSANRVTVFSDDFSTPANWNITTSGQGTFQIVTTTPTQQTTYMGAMASTTASNGFATFNGIQYLLATPPSVDAQNTSVTLASSVDLSAYPAVTVDFQQRYRPFNTDQVFVEVSADNGTTWTSFELNTQYPVNNAAVQNTISQNVSSAIGGSATALVRFTWINTSDDDQYGSGYGWMVDDVQINTAPDDNLVLISSDFFDASSQTNWGDKVNYTLIPVSQVHDMQFSGSFENQGATTANNASVAVTVSNSVPTVVFSGNTPVANVNSLSTVYGETTTNHTISTTTGQYDIAFTATYDNIATDASPTNNAATGTYWVTTNEYGRDNNIYSGGGLWNGTGNAYELGPVYEAKANMDINRIRVAFATGTDAGIIACVKLYQVDASTGDFLLIDENCGTTYEKTLTAADISGASVTKWVDFVICESLVAGEFYIPVVNHYGGADDMLVMSGGNADTSTVFLLDGTDNTWYYTTSIPKVRLVEGACDVNVSEMVDLGFSLSQNIPNPANGTTSITYTLAEAGEVSFEVVDITGKVVSTLNIGQKSVGDYNITFDASSFAPGVYFYTLTVGNAKITKRMVITN
jgi:hypothetical protein